MNYDFYEGRPDCTWASILCYISGIVVLVKFRYEPPAAAGGLFWLYGGIALLGTSGLPEDSYFPASSTR